MRRELNREPSMQESLGSMNATDEIYMCLGYLIDICERRGFTDEKKELDKAMNIIDNASHNIFKKSINNAIE